MRALVFALVVLAGCRQQKLLDTFDARCFTPCYGGAAINAGKGICTLGTWQCVDGETAPVCEGWVAPQKEQCDGLDNDCNGRVDEGLTRSCSTACGRGTESCIAGTYQHCTAPAVAPEVCDGIDNDCNGLVDDGLPVVPCYPGNQSDLLHGECHFGIQRCVAGTLTCTGWQGPRPEVCDGLDNNCNGAVDEGVSHPLDLVFLVDYSGSMTNKIPYLQLATTSWASKYSGRGDLKIALVSIPSDDSLLDGLVTPMLPLSDPGVFASTLAQHSSASGGSAEPSIDGFWMTTETQDPLGLGWTTGASRIVIGYTDEQPQSYMNQPVLLSDMIDAGIQTHTTFVVFTVPNIGWEPMNPLPFQEGSDLEKTLDTIIAQGSCQ